MVSYFGVVKLLTIFIYLDYSIISFVSSNESYSTLPSWEEWENRILSEIGGSIEDDLCETLYCKKGETCVLVDTVATCQCRERCPKSDSPVCATGYITYQSHCHFYLEKCQKGLKHHRILRKGACSVENSSTTQDTRQLKENNNLNLRTFEINISPSTTISTVITTITSTAKENVTIKNDERQSVCERDDFLFIPSNLLLYFHAKYAENARGEVEHGKAYLVHLMFSTFDMDGDKVLTRNEINYAEKDERYSKLMPPGCHLAHLIQLGDLDGDDELSNSEFYSIFGLSATSVSHEKATKNYFMEVGKQYQIYCDIDLQNNPNTRITWYRYDVPLVNVVPLSFEVSADGSLYLTPASLLHSGNFTCRAGSNPVLEQKHIVHVHEPPVVELESKFLLLKSSEDDYLRCNVKKGYPLPGLIWEKNSVKISENVSIFELLNAKPADTGSYKCIATNSFGNSEESASVVVRDNYQEPELFLRKVEKEHPPRVLTLHKNGISVYNGFDCSLNKIIFTVGANQTNEKLSKICRNGCLWSDLVVILESKLAYALLEDDKSLISINTTTGDIEEVFQLHHIPKRMWYVSWADSLWIESWHDQTGRYRTVQAMRSASKSIPHSLAHALPMHDEYDSVSNVFIPTVEELIYGYVTHWQEYALHKFDLKTMKLVSRLSLAPYDCHPSHAEFVSQSGLAVLNCVKSNGTIFKGQLVIDYMSDSVLNYDSGIHGIPLATPDGQFLLTIDAPMGRIFIQKIVGKEIHFWQTLDEFLPLTDWTLHSTRKLNNWILIATSVYSTQLVEINISEAKVEKTMNIGTASSEIISKPGQTIISPLNSHYLIYTANNSLTVTDLYKQNENGCKLLTNTTGVKLMALI